MAIPFSNENLTLAQVRDFVSQLSELSIGASAQDDITTDIVNGFVKEGFQKIYQLSTRYPYYQASLGFTTTANTKAYNSLTYTNPAGLGTISLSGLNQVISVVNNTNTGNSLIYLDQFKAESIWVGTNDVAGIPAYFTIWGNQIFLYPKPDAAYVITVRAFRRPKLDWFSDVNLAIDISPDFQLPLINYVMARIFQYQEDPEMANVYMRNYEQEVALVQQNLTAPNNNQPMIMSGGLQLDRGYWWSMTPYLQVLPNSPYPLGVFY